MTYGKKNKFQEVWDKSKESELYNLSLGLAFVGGILTCYIVLNFLNLLR